MLAVGVSLIPTFVRLVRYYWRLGKAARRFFWGIIGRTVRRSPRSTRQMVQFLGMYKHFCEVNAHSFSWDPWAAPPEAPEPAAPVASTA